MKGRSRIKQFLAPLNKPPVVTARTLLRWIPPNTIVCALREISDRIWLNPPNVSIAHLKLWSDTFDEIVPVYVVLCAIVSSQTCPELRFDSIGITTTVVGAYGTDEDEYRVNIDVASEIDDYRFSIGAAMVVVPIGEVPRLKITFGLPTYWHADASK